MTGKVLSFPDGKEVPVDKTTTRETIADHQTKKFADSLADDLVIQMVSSMQQDGLNIGKASGHKFDLKHPFHNITDKMMYVEKVKGRKYSVVNYSGTKIEKVPEPEPDNVVEFESDIDFNDTD